MSLLMNSFKTTAAGLALFAAATATTAEAAPGSNDAAREQQRRAQSSQTYQQQAPSSGSLTARDACRNLAQGPSLQELPATGKAFVAGSDLGCELVRVGGAYSVTRTYDFAAPGQAAAFNASFTAATRAEKNTQRVESAQQEREDRKGSLLNQGRELMNDGRGILNLKRQGEGLLRGLGIGR